MNVKEPRSLRRSARYFYLLSMGIIFVLPLLFLFIYENLAGGLLNGIWGTYDTGLISGDALVGGVYPLVAIAAYGLLGYYAKEVISRRHKYGLPQKAVMTILFLLATIVTVLIIFWKQLVT